MKGLHELIRRVSQDAEVGSQLDDVVRKVAARRVGDGHGEGQLKT